MSSNKRYLKIDLMVELKLQPNEARCHKTRITHTSEQGGTVKDQPLTVEVFCGELIIRIGVNTLEFCTRPENGGKLEGCQVNRRRRTQFAKDVAREITHEEENGDTPLTLLLDKMIQCAADRGSAAIDHE